VPVQVPRLERFAPQGEQSVGRLEVNLPDPSRAQAIQTQAAEGLVKTVANEYQQYENQKADTESNVAQVEYHNRLSGELENVKRLEGNPTPLYEKFDEDSEKTYLEILNKYKDASQTTKTAVQEKLDNVRGKFSDRRLSAYSNQSEKYDEGVFISTLAIHKDDIIDATTYVDPNDPKSTIGLDVQLSKLSDDIIRNGEKRGLVTQDEKGNYSYAPSIKMRLAKEKGENLTAAIENLLYTGKPKAIEAAKFLSEKYSADIDSVNNGKIRQKIQKESVDQEALQAYDNVRGLPFSQAMKKLDGVKDLEVRNKAEAYLSSYRDKQERTKGETSKVSFNAIGKIILEKKFSSLVDFENDPRVKRMMPGVTEVKHIQALHQMIVQPKESRPEARTAAFSSLFSGKLKNMSPEDFAELQTGLSSDDASTLRKEWISSSLESGAERSKIVQTMGTELTKQLTSLNYIKRDTDGKFMYDKKNQDKLNAAHTELMMVIDQLPANLSYKEQTEWVAKFAAAKAKNEIFVPPEAPERFEGSPTTTTVPASTTLIKPNSMTDDQVFRKKQGISNLALTKLLGRPPSRQELRDHMDTYELVKGK